MSQTVVGIFDSASDAHKAIEHLITDGFSRERIDLSAANGTELSHSRDYSTASHTSDRNDNDGIGNSISNFFSNLFDDDEDEARRYSSVAERGTLVTVHTSSREESERAARILDEYGTVDVPLRASQYGENAYSEADFTSRADLDTNAPIQVIEENLQVGKREVETGAIRVRSRIIERPVEETLRLREERVWVNRNPVNRPATEADLAAFKEGTIELTQHAEIPVVAKEARVVEEITVGKAVEEHEQTIRETVRRTDVDVEETKREENLGLGKNI